MQCFPIHRDRCFLTYSVNMEISDTALRVAWLSLAILGRTNGPEQRLCPITYSIHPYDYAVLTPPIHRLDTYDVNSNTSSVSATPFQCPVNHPQSFLEINGENYTTPETFPSNRISFRAPPPPCRRYALKHTMAYFCPSQNDNVKRAQRVG